MHGPTSIFWVTLTPFSRKAREQKMESAAEDMRQLSPGGSGSDAMLAAESATKNKMAKEAEEDHRKVQQLFLWSVLNVLECQVSKTANSDAHPTKGPSFGSRCGCSGSR
jgi:hypothetical protein